LNGNGQTKILIIDDCTVPRLLVAEMVAQLGFKPITASNGAEGLRLLHEQSPSLVLLDVIMPDLDGFAVTAAIRAQAKLLPIILLTTLDDVDTKRRGQQAGADDFLAKPVQLPDLQVRIAAMLRIKALNDALATANRRLSSLIETLPDGVGVVCDGQVVFANPTLTTMLGFDRPPELLGQPLLDFVVAEDRGRLAERLRRFAAGQPLPSGEYRFVRSDGKIMIIECTGTAIDFDHRPALLEIMRDVTEAHRMREQVLLNDRMASLGTLAAGIGHEINNPLAFIAANLDFISTELSGMSQAGARGPDLGEIRTALDECRVGADRVKRIVRDLKTFSRNPVDTVSAVDVHAVLDWTLQVAGNEIRHRAQLVKDYGEVRRVKANDVRLSQVFLNLLMNAAQAIPVGHTQSNHIRVSTREQGDCVVIEVSDTGCGIAPETQRRLFEPFFTTKAVGEGSGLGLSICYSIVRQLGGDISVHSELGAGSSFRLTLPAADAVVASDPADRPERRLMRKGRILVVDDEPLIGSIVRRMLPEHEVTFEVRARDAMGRLAAGERFDVLLCDIMMPDMSGIELHSWIMEAAPDLARRTVFLTGGTFAAEAVLFARHSPQPVLEKPIDFAALRQLLQEALTAASPTAVMAHARKTLAATGTD
jgi:PAS domain S-box-containing protein